MARGQAWITWGWPWVVLAMASLLLASGPQGSVDPRPESLEADLSVRQGAAMARARMTLAEAVASLAPLPRPTQEPIAAAGAPSAGALRHYARAQWSMREGRGQLHAAIRELDSAARLEPRNPDILLAQAQAYAALGNRARATHLLRQAVGLNPSSFDALFALGRVLFEQGLWDEAIVTLEAARLRMGESRETQGVASLDPTARPLLNFYLAAALQQSGFDNASIDRYLAFLDDSLESNRTTSMLRERFLLMRQRGPAWQAVGDAYHRLDRPEDALKAYEQAQQDEHTVPETLTPRLVYTRVRLGQGETAMTLLLAQLDDDPTDATAMAMVRGLADQGVDPQRVVLQLAPLYHRHGQATGLLLLIDDLAGDEQSLMMLTSHVATRPTDRPAFERLMVRLAQAGTVAEDAKAVTVLAQATRGDLSLAVPYAGVVERVFRSGARVVAAVERVDAADRATPAVRLLEGIALAQLGQFDEATGPLGEALAAGLEVARPALAKIAMQQGRMEDARRLLDEAKDPRDPATLKLRVATLVASGEVDEAVERLDELIALSPQDLEPVLTRARLLVRVERAVEAERTLLDALNRMPDAEVIYAELFELYDAAAVPDATRQYERLMVRLLGRMPESRIARLQRAALADADRDFKQAQTLLRGLLDENPADYEALDQLLEVLVRDERANEAQALLDEQLEARPTDPGLLRVAIDHYRQRVRDPQRGDLVAERYLRALEPTAERDVELARLLLRSGRAQEAVELLTARLEDPELGDAAVSVVMLLGEALVDLGQVEELNRRMPALMERFADRRADVWFEWARLVGLAGDTARSMAMMEELLKAYPDHATAANNLGYAWANSDQRLEEALTLIARAVDAEPGNAAYLDSMGWVLYKLGRFDEALVQFATAQRTPGGQNPIILDHMGDTLYRLGRQDEATRLWARAQVMLRELGPLAVEFDPEMQGLDTRLQGKIDAVANQLKPPIATSRTDTPPGSPPGSAPGDIPADNPITPATP